MAVCWRWTCVHARVTVSHCSDAQDCCRPRSLAQYNFMVARTLAALGRTDLRAEDEVGPAYVSVCLRLCACVGAQTRVCVCVLCVYAWA